MGYIVLAFDHQGACRAGQPPPAEAPHLKFPTRLRRIPGHGQSEGDRCYVERFSHYVDDAVQFVTAEVGKLRGTPLESAPKFLLVSWRLFPPACPCLPLLAPVCCYTTPYHPALAPTGTATRCRSRKTGRTIPYTHQPRFLWLSAGPLHGGTNRYPDRSPHLARLARYHSQCAGYVACPSSA